MIVINAATQMMALGWILVIQTAYVILVARFLGPGDFGTFSFAWGVVQIFLIGGDLGLHNTVLRRVSSEPSRSEEITSTFFFLKTCLTLLSLSVIGLVAVLLPEEGSAAVALVLFGGGMAFHSIGIAINILYQAHGRLYLGSINSVVVFLAQFVFGVAMLLAGGRVVALALAYLLACLLGLIVNYRLFKKKFHPIHLTLSPGWRTFARESLPVGVGTFFQSVSGRLAITLLTFLAGPFATGIFSSASRITVSLGNIPVGILSAVLPVMASQQGQSSVVRRLFRRSVGLLLVLSVLLSAALLQGSDWLIKLIYGSGYAEAAGTLRILAFSLIPIFVGMVFSHVVLSQNRLVGRVPVVTGLGMLAALVANWMLIPRLGSAGAAIAVVISETVLAAGYAIAACDFLFRGPEDSKQD